MTLLALSTVGCRSSASRIRPVLDSVVPVRFIPVLERDRRDTAARWIIIHTNTSCLGERCDVERNKSGQHIQLRCRVTTREPRPNDASQSQPPNRNHPKSPRIAHLPNQLTHGNRKTLSRQWRASSSIAEILGLFTWQGSVKERNYMLVQVIRQSWG